MVPDNKLLGEVRRCALGYIFSASLDIIVAGAENSQWCAESIRTVPRIFNEGFVRLLAKQHSDCNVTSDCLIDLDVDHVFWL